MSKREEECVHVCVYIYMSGFSVLVHVLWLCVH